MTTQIACSACRAVFSAGEFCPNCGLQLTAQAVAVVAPRKSIWPVFLGIFGVALLIAFIGGSISNHIDDANKAAAKTAFLAELSAGKLNTPVEFIGHCGNPLRVDSTKRGTELRYRTGYGELEYVVTLSTAAPSFEMEHTDYHDNGTADAWRDKRDADDAFEILHCK